MKKSVSTKGMLVFLCIIMLFTMTACGEESVYFNNIHLGMLQNEIVKQNESWGEPHISLQDYILYEDVKYNDLRGETSYTFDTDGKLIHSSIIIAEEKKSSETYNNLVETLSTEYGKSTTLYENATIWQMEEDEDAYILCILDKANDNISLIMCTQEVYNWIMSIKSVNAQH